MLEHALAFEFFSIYFGKDRTMTCTPFLGSEEVSLRPVEPSDYKLIHEWINRRDFSQHLFYGQLPMNIEQVERMFREQIESSSNVVFMIEVSIGRGNVTVGITGFYDIDSRSRNADFRLHIGEADWRSRGLGTKVVKLMLFYGFDTLNLHRVGLGVTADHERAVRLYEGAGFHFVGTFRDRMFRYGEYHSARFYDMLRDEYEETFSKEYRRRFAPQPEPKPETKKS